MVYPEVLPAGLLCRPTVQHPCLGRELRVGLAGLSLASMGVGTAAWFMVNRGFKQLMGSRFRLAGASMSTVLATHVAVHSKEISPA